MIKAVELQDTGNPEYRFRGDISLNVICERLKEINEEEFDVPIHIYRDKVKSGGLLNSSIEDCLIIENEEHLNDYYKFCITTRKQGKFTVITMNFYGQSKLAWKASRSEERRKNGTLGGLIMNALSGVNEAEYKAENDYYSMVVTMFDELCN